MSRPKPKILLEHIDKKTYKSDQVLAADAHRVVPKRF